MLVEFESTTFPIVPDSIFIPFLSLDNSADAAPVDVNVVVLGFGPPYSTGYLYCFSAALLWEDVNVITFLANLFSMKFAPNIRPNVLVEQAA